MKKVCEQCSIEFNAISRKRRFCSGKCSSRHQFPLKFDKCKHCNKSFKVTVDSKHFCCQSCYFQFKAKKTRLSVCKTCNKSFEHPDWKCNSFTYCSNECRYKRGDVKYRKKAFDALKNECVFCITGHGRLEVHHIDCNRANNEIKNLCITCHSCHLRIHALIKRSGFNPRTCFDLMLKTDIIKLNPYQFRAMWKDFQKLRFEIKESMNLSKYLKPTLLH
jgi:hypothetical protein